MKRPEYVATVVKNYRKAIDEGSKNLSIDDKRDVEQIFNRGFTRGLMFGDFGRDLITVERPDNRGVLLGKVARADKYNVFVLLQEDIDEGDGMEFITVNGEYKGIKAPFSGKKGTTMKIEKPGYILNDTLVYKTSSVKLLSDAKASYQTEKVKNPIDMEININIDDNPKLMIMYRGKMVTAVAESKVEKSERVALSKEKVIEQLSKLGDTTYSLNNININLDEGAYLPVSTLNLLRREAIEKLDKLVENTNHRKPIDTKEFHEIKKSFFEFKDKRKNKVNNISVRVNTMDQFNQLDLDKLDRVYLGFYENIEKAVKKAKDQDKEVYVWTDKIIYQEGLDNLGEIIETIEKDIDGISVSNLGSLKYMKDRFDLKIHGDIGLNAFNSFTMDYLDKIGLGSITLSPELNLNQIKKVNEGSNAFTEAIVYGYLPVMVTKHCPMSLVKGCKNDKACGSCQYAKGYGIKDRMNITFKMDRRDGFTNIYNSVPLMVLDNLKQIYNSGVSMARIDFTTESRNIRSIQRAFYDYSKGIIDDNGAREFIESFRENTSITNGHYFRGIL